MELYIAGGVGEHGRNCFYVTSENLQFMVDCGIMADDSENPYPRLSGEQIRSAQYLFLTHSHNDHSGGIEFLHDNGFKGKIIAAGETLRQLSLSRSDGVSLESISIGGSGEYGGLKIQWGRSGHCAGSVWYRFERNGRDILFSGDYTENTLVFECDKIRELTADTAVIDCAYGSETHSFDDCCKALVRRTNELLDKHGAVVFPVPKHGRGEELLRLFALAEINAAIYSDNNFIKNAAAGDRFWRKEGLQKPPIIKCLGLQSNERRIIFVSDPQLRNSEIRNEVSDIIIKGGFAVMTGTVERGGYSSKLIESGCAELLRYPVHQNIEQYKKLIGYNNFTRTIPYHSAEIRL